MQHLNLKLNIKRIGKFPYTVTAWPPVPNNMLVVPVKNVCIFMGAEYVTPGD